MSKWSIKLVMLFTFINLKFHQIQSEMSKNECHSSCAIKDDGVIVSCKDLKFSDDDKVIGLNLACIPIDKRNQAVGLMIENLTLHTLDFDFIETNSLSQISTIVIRGSNISNIVGRIPCSVSNLTLSHNNIHNFSAVLVENIINSTMIDSTTTNARINETCGSQNLVLDLRGNKLYQLPIEIISSHRLRSVYLSSEFPLNCEFIWDTVWESKRCRNRIRECRDLFAEQNATECQYGRIWKYTLDQVFDSKITQEKECSEIVETVNCTCQPFNFLRSDNGTPVVYLSVNCFGRELTDLPNISELTWELNASNNLIRNLSKLNSTMYRNIRILDLSYNLIEDLADLANTNFTSRFDYLYLNSNKFHKIPDILFTKAKSSEGKAILRIGSELDCDCHTATNTKGRMIDIQNTIEDTNDVLCANILRPKDSQNNEDENGTTHFLRLKDLKDSDVCPSRYSTSDGVFDWIYLVIALEAVAITVVVLKLFYDWKEYQRTGILPWIAQKLPRLPCDGILEK